MTRWWFGNLPISCSYQSEVSLFVRYPDFAFIMLIYRFHFIYFLLDFSVILFHSPSEPFKMILILSFKFELRFSRDAIVKQTFPPKSIYYYHSFALRYHFKPSISEFLQGVIRIS